MVGPSANGSLKGMPTSMMSANSAAARMAAVLASRLGYPAVRYGMSARRPPARNVDQVRESGESDKVVANRNSIACGVGNLYDRPPVASAFVLFSEIDLSAGRSDRSAIRIYRNPNEGSLELFAIRVGRGDDGHLEAVENHAGPDRVHADQVNQGLHQHPVISAIRVLPQFPQDLVGLDRHGLIHPPCRGGIESVGHGHDSREAPERAGPAHLGIGGEIGLQ